VRFLLEELCLDHSCKDDSGRTPLDVAGWAITEPQHEPIIQLLKVVAQHPDNGVLRILASSRFRIQWPCVRVSLVTIPVSSSLGLRERRRLDTMPRGRLQGGLGMDASDRGEGEGGRWGGRAGLLAYTTRLEETPIWKAAKHLANADMVAYLVG
jgi:hypothetical protein